ncbi:lactadherin-like [Anneissia japonica]|uniref:lactadherin-like n=1 Tax=Anneissia japonica TaxID=1529436 RepID=UPI0014255D87|nr:lactadherin-like [Anneissia japonica]
MDSKILQEEPHPWDSLALGVEDGTVHLTASSEFNNDLRADRGRLNTVAGGSGGWAAATNNLNQWIQADLGAIKGVIGVITQGRSEDVQWVTSYKVNYSTDGSNYLPVLGSSGQVENFSANSDSNSEVKNIFNSVVYAQFIRINPITWQKHISLRFELLGTGYKLIHYDRPNKKGGGIALYCRESDKDVNE